MSVTFIPENTSHNVECAIHFECSEFLIVTSRPCWYQIEVLSIIDNRFRAAIGDSNE